MIIKYVEWNGIQNETGDEPTLISVIPAKNLCDKMEVLIDSYLKQDGLSYELFVDFQRSVRKMLTSNENNTDDDAILNDLLVEIEWILEDVLHDEKSYIIAQLMSFAHLVSARISYLNLSSTQPIDWLDPRDIIVTDENWEEAQIDLTISQLKMKKQLFSSSVISTHGIGSTTDNQNTLTEVHQFWELLLRSK